MNGPPSREIRIALVAEDRRLASFVEPALVRISREAEREARLVGVELTHGCRISALKALVSTLAPVSEVLVIALDAGGRSHRRKKRSLRAHLPPSPRPVSLAVAAPAVEAWLLADAVAFSRGLTEGTGVNFERPARWPVPRSEREAKAMLGELVVAGFRGQRLPAGGFEYAPEIVDRMDLFRSTNASLAEWARECTTLLRA